MIKLTGKKQLLFLYQIPSNFHHHVIWGYKHCYFFRNEFFLASFNETFTKVYRLAKGFPYHDFTQMFLSNFICAKEQLEHDKCSYYDIIELDMAQYIQQYFHDLPDVNTPYWQKPFYISDVYFTHADIDKGLVGLTVFFTEDRPPWI